jgi:hypothetical protein
MAHASTRQRSEGLPSPVAASSREAGGIRRSNPQPELFALFERKREASEELGDLSPVLELHHLVTRRHVPVVAHSNARLRFHAGTGSAAAIIAAGVAGEATRRAHWPRLWFEWNPNCRLKCGSGSGPAPDKLPNRLALVPWMT